MNCQNCGSPLDHAEETCAFCGSRNTALPKAEVPLQHQRGEGRELSKTYDDSLASIKAGMEYSDQVHRAHVRRSKVGLAILMLVLGSPMLFLLYMGYKSRKPHVDFEGCLVAGVNSVIAGDYPSGIDSFTQALKEKPDAPEAHFLFGSACMAELLQKPHMEAEKRKTVLFWVYREMHQAMLSEPNHARAHFFTGLYYAQRGERDNAITSLQSCLAQLSNIKDEGQRKAYGDAAAAALKTVKAKGKLSMYSQLDEARKADPKEAIEVPFGR